MKFKAENDIGVEVYTLGTISWFQNGNLHREDGPAVVYTNGSKYWFINGECHREDGPAITHPGGRKYFYFEGGCYDEKTYWERINEF